MSTAVISANEAMHYANELWHGLPVMYATIALLALFMGLAIMGLTDSARVAVGIFITHLITLTLLLVVGIGYLMFHVLDTLSLNWRTPEPGGFVTAMFLGFSAALLGISGFESSANFVEEQAEGVFPKTLRNMWFAVSFFNPAMAVLALALVSSVDIQTDEKLQTALLAHMGEKAGGAWLGWVG